MQAEQIYSVYPQSVQVGEITLFVLLMWSAREPKNCLFTCVSAQLDSNEAVKVTVPYVVQVEVEVMVWEALTDSYCAEPQ